eukprot:jgi/Botrbrau1/7779/Bobra.0159s0207.1
MSRNSSDANLSTTPSNPEPPTSSSDGKCSTSSSDLCRTPLAEYVPFGKMVEAAVTALERNVISTQNKHSLLLKLVRTQFSPLQLEGMCWSESEGDIYVEFTRVSPFQDGIPRRPLVEISHADNTTNSRVLGQLRRFLKDLRESPMSPMYDISCASDLPEHILQVYTQLKQHLQALPQHCLNCNLPHTLQESHHVWRSAACARQQHLCKGAALAMQLGDTLSKISMAPAVAELEVSLYAAAIKQTESRPSVLSDAVLYWDYISRKLCPDNPEKDWRKILSTLNALPPLHELPTGSQALEMHLDGKAPGLFRLMQCVLNRAPGFLVQVRDGEFLKDAGIYGIIPHIFLYHPNDVAQMRSFNDLQFAAGCLRRAFAFHGSANHNWLGILRDGLKWASAVGLHRCVAPKGKGISLARCFGESSTYCHGEGPMWPESTLPDDPGLMALCEILYEPSEVKCGGLYVVKDPERVAVRALLVFSRSDRNSSNVATAEEESLCMNADKLASRLTALPIYQELHAWEPQ